MTSFLPWQLKSELRVVFWTRELRMRGARKLDFVVKYFFPVKALMSAICIPKTRFCILYRHAVDKSSLPAVFYTCVFHNTLAVCFGLI